MKRRIVAMAVFAMGSVVTGCGYDVFGPSYYGSYDLRWVNGREVPATVYETRGAGTSYRADISYGTLHLRHDGTFSMDVELRETDSRGVHVSTQGYSGTYERDGPDLFLYYIDPFTNRDGTLSGFVRDGYVEVLLAGIVDGQILQCGFER